jgi:hypothetical protein
MQAAAAVGYGGGQDHEAILAAARVPAGRYSHFVELHIEQVWWPDCELHQYSNNAHCGTLRMTSHAMTIP